MQVLTTLITPDGEGVLPGSPEFLAAIGDADPNFDSIAFAVKNLGFIKIQLIEDLVVEIEIHPRNVELPALLAVQQCLLSCTARLFRIKYLTTEWCSEISSSAERTVARLSEICVPAFTPPSSERFVVESQDLSFLFADDRNPMRPLVQMWRVSFGFFDSTVISLAARHRLLPRLMIAGIKPKRPEPTWRFFGDGHRWIGDEYRIQGVGEKVINMPDKDYGGWATEYYKSVATSGQPRYDIVTGAVKYEDESGKPLKPVRYERLMLPWRTPSEEVFVTMCSRRFGTDDIPSVDLDADWASRKSAMSS